MSESVRAGVCVSVYLVMAQWPLILYQKMHDL